MKAFLATAILLLLAASSHAQFIKGYGVKMGMLVSEQEYNEDIIPGIIEKSEFDNRWGPQMVIFLDFIQLPFFSLQSELNYLQRGSQQDFPFITVQNPEGTGEYHTQHYSLEYLSLNIAGKLILKKPAVQPYLLGGLGLNYFLKTRHPLFFRQKHFRTFTPGVLLGAGLEFPQLLASGILVEVRYNADLTYTANNDSYEMHHRTWEFLMGVRLK
ncbi:MAG: hypothetical protein WAN36_07510 [Calditrichia bacterium]